MNRAIPLVKELTALVARRDEDAARFVHYGATSDDLDRLFDPGNYSGLAEQLVDRAVAQRTGDH